MIDQDFIYYRSGDISSNNYLQPIILGLPLQINESSSIESDFIGCLAFITEPVIAQAKTQQVLSDDLIDRLLVSSWESLESLLLAVESARDIVDKDSSQPVPKADDEVEFLLNPDSADRSNRTTSGQTEQYSSPTQASTTRHVRKSKNSKLKIFYLFQSIVLTILLWLYANDYIVSFKEKLIAAGLLTIILILDLIILLHPQSKQKPKETTYQKRSREKSIERTNADRIFKDELKGLYKGGTPSGRQIQPLATLKPLELAYPESDVEYALAIRAFVSVTISHANFCIGADAVVSDLCLKGKEILPIHAEIKYNPEGYMLHSNHGLTNPKKPEFRSELWLNGILLKSNEILPLNDGDEIRFGRYIYSFEMD